MKGGDMVLSGCKSGKYLLPRLFPVTLCVLLSVPLLGQAQRQGNNNTPRQQQTQNCTSRRGGSGFEALSVILRTLQDKPPASLVILDIREVGWESQARSMLQQDPLVALNLNVLGLYAASGAGLELIQREGWTADVPRWCLISTDGRVLYSSEMTPNPDLIMEAFASAGLRSHLDILRQFLLMYPDHAEARLAMLSELRSVADARTRAALGVTGDRLGRGSAYNPVVNPLDAMTAVPPPPELDMGADSYIWGEYAREADNAFQAELWKQNTSQLFSRVPRELGAIGLMGGFQGQLVMGGSSSFVSNLAQYSPMMKAMYRRWLPDIEYHLSRRPSSSPLWNFWLAVQRVAGGRDLGALQASLAFAPVDYPGTLPITMVRPRWLQDCIERGDWRMAEDVARDAWGKLMSQTERGGFVSQGDRFTGRGRFSVNQESGRMESNMLDGGAWIDVAEPYIDLLLRQRKTGAADTVVQWWFGQGGWSGAAQRASFLAKRLGLEDLGNKWSAMAPPTRYRF
jgi:hypothetical protein